VHVIADAATSVLAIAALVGGWLWGWSWLDPLMGLVGAVLVGVWAKGLVVDTAKVLLDREMDHPVVEEIREVVEADAGTGDSRLADLHVWRVGQGAYACALTVVTHDRSPDAGRRAPAPVGARGGGAQHHRDPPLPGPSLKQAGNRALFGGPGIRVSNLSGNSES
jgi:Co/Zn/Cd efflux system component